MTGGTLWSLLAAVTSQGATLLVGLLSARILGAERYGQLAIVIATTGMLGVFAGLGLGLTATKFVAELRERDPGRLARILALLDRSVAVSGLIAIVLLFLAAPFLAGTVLGEPSLEGPLRLAAPLLLLNELTGVQTGVLGGFEAFRTVATVASARGLATVVTVTAGALVAGVEGAIVGFMIATGVGVLLGRLEVRRLRAARGAARFEGRLTAELPILWRFALPAFIASVLVGPVSWVGSALLVRQPGGLAALGVFNAANQWRTSVLFIPNVIGQAVLPVMASLAAAGRTASLRRLLLSAVGASGVIALPIALALIVGRDFIMGLYGPEFADDGQVLALIGLTVFVMAVQLPVGQVLVATGRVWLGAATNLAWALAFLVAIAVFVDPVRGALGLALAYLVSYALHTSWTLVAAWLAIGGRTRRRR